MKKTIILAAMAGFILSTGDADARRRVRHIRHHSASVDTVRSVPIKAQSTSKELSPFERSDLDEVPYHGYMSVVQAEAASRYTWLAKEIFPPVRVEVVQWQDISALDKGLKPIITPYVERNEPARQLLIGLLVLVGCSLCLASAGMAAIQGTSRTKQV